MEGPEGVRTAGPVTPEVARLVGTRDRGGTI